MPKRVHFGDFSIYQRSTKRNGGTTVRWYGDFRSLGGGQKALSPRLVGEAGRTASGAQQQFQRPVGQAL